jgi:nucleotide-binding universal stress UspA family protein
MLHQGHMIFMFEKVLYATDFSEPACKTLDWISGMADVREIVLLHVIDATHGTKKGWIRDLDLKKAEFELEDQKKHLVKSGLDGKVRLEIITSGDVADAIVAVAEDEEVSLIIIGTRGRGLVKTALLGSVSRAVLHRAMVHILIMHHPVSDHRVSDTLTGKKYEHESRELFSKILYPTDFSRSADEVLPLLKNLKGFDKVLLLHVINRGKTAKELDVCVRDAQNRLGDLCEQLQEAGKKAVVSVRLGSPPEEISRLAEEADVSLIIMSRHGYGWMREIMVGSTTYDVAKRTRRPLLVVQPGIPAW